MLQLVYISTARQSISPELLESILNTSRRNNEKAQVTGLLVAGGRRFLQALEGPDQAVLDTYARIQADPRHRAVVLLSCRPIEERGFGDWSMAYEDGGQAWARDDLTSVVSALTGALSDKNLRAQFLGFAELNSQAA